MAFGIPMSSKYSHPQSELQKLRENSDVHTGPEFWFYSSWHGQKGILDLFLKCFGEQGNGTHHLLRLWERMNNKRILNENKKSGQQKWILLKKNQKSKKSIQDSAHILVHSSCPGASITLSVKTENIHLARESQESGH